ncbi:MAG TPA: hypothetical protein PLJ39_13070 [Spirochaetota bacterium]|jgi:hypothetical protein|nr:hypothetical protein [Spirochaetota bacterium]
MGLFPLWGKIIFFTLMLLLPGVFFAGENDTLNYDNTADISPIIEPEGFNLRISAGYGFMSGSVSSDEGKYIISGKSYLLAVSCGYAFSGSLVPFADLRFSICPVYNTRLNGKSYDEGQLRFIYDSSSIGIGVLSYLLDTNVYVSEALYFNDATYGSDRINCALKYGAGLGIKLGYDFRIGEYSGFGIFLSYYGSYSKMRENSCTDAVGHEFNLGLSYVSF